MTKYKCKSCKKKFKTLHEYAKHKLTEERIEKRDE